MSRPQATHPRPSSRSAAPSTRPEVLGTFASLAALALLSTVSLTGCKATNTPAVASAAAPTSAHGPSAYPNPNGYPVEQGSSALPGPVPTPISLGGFGGFGEPAPALAGDPPNITARAAILVDERGRVLFEKNADTRMPAASTQKLLLGILVAERGNLSQTVRIEESDTWAEPTVMGIKPGQTFTREELLKAVLVRSSNDIARALGRDHSGSEAAFVAAMNARARQLGMHNSYFTNSNGLPKPAGQYSTARDLALLGLVSIRTPAVKDMIRIRSTTFRFPDGTTRTLNNTNQVLRNFEYCTGAKTGFTNAAGRCLVSSATANGRTVVAVILGSATPTVWNESEALLRYGLGL